jgi:flagellar basal body-associated protein FliL
MDELNQAPMQETKPKKKLTWLWIVLAIIIILAIVYFAL